MDFIEQLCLAWVVGFAMGGLFLSLMCMWVHRSDSHDYEDLDFI
jgi:hypothetical protein